MPDYEFETFHINLVLICAALLQRCSPVSDEKITFALEIFNRLIESQDELILTHQICRYAIDQEIDLELTAQHLIEVTTKEEQETILNGFAYIITQIGNNRQQKRQLILDLGTLLKIPRYRIEWIINNFVKKTALKHYFSLGVKPGVSKAEVQKVYRNLSLKYHPDRVRHMGGIHAKIAEMKFKRINEAYHELLKEV